MSNRTPNEGETPNGVTPQVKSKLPFYRVLWVQVLIAIALAIALGYVNPARAIAMKPLGDAFIRVISMIITLVIFCTVVTGIAGMENLKKVGRVGGMALIYFEAVSTIALFIGLVVGNVVHPEVRSMSIRQRSMPSPWPTMPDKPRPRTSPTS